MLSFFQRDILDDILDLTESVSESFPTALDKREYLVIIMNIFCQFCIKTYVVNIHRQGGSHEG